MKVTQRTFLSSDDVKNMNLAFEPDLMLIFVSPDFKDTAGVIDQLSKRYPNTSITGCSTSGEIVDINVKDNSLILNAIQFEKTKHQMVSANIKDFENSSQLGEKLFTKLSQENLQHILIFSDGLLVNGADFLKGLHVNAKDDISVTGGMAGDGEDFNSTFVINNNEIKEGEVVAIGLYGDAINIGYSSKAGWDSFGLERLVTKSKDNILYEIDGRPALELYKSFLGEKAKELPASGLLFPLSMRTKNDQKPVIRTLLGINEEDQSVTFASSIPEGSYVRLMKANVDRLINGAEDSAMNAKNELNVNPDFALLISCVGRRLVLKQLIEEEVEAVRDILGNKPVISGFYSYGEIAPFNKFSACELHNQTMTITTFSEVV